ncbi:unnamed protein product [Hyaloperonospora brassicae]|uniref:Uncharacterized protein n=1 Tax=Hyaloperonospora brassicae TaxID=162125 RepID=A0AAV0UXL5_HYABA|nr:unnamed protein product [Hyaloperonospora brassicae]
MVTFVGLFGAAATAAVFAVAAVNGDQDTTSAVSASVQPAADLLSVSRADLTVDTACVLTDFRSATPDFIALNNIVAIIKNSPSLLSPYVSDPLIIEDVTLAALNYSYLGYDLLLTPTFNWFNVSGITTIAPYAVNVTSHNKVNLGAAFTGTVALNGTITFEVAQLKRSWAQICVVDPLHPIECNSQTVTVHLTVSVEKPHVTANVKANVIECAPGIPVTACQNLTMSTITVDALGGNISAVYASVYKHLKDVKINTLKLGWDVITENDIAYVVHDANPFVSHFLTQLLSTDIDRLNEKGAYYHRYVHVVRAILLSLMDKTVDSSLEPQFRATCL